jgi:hypothetical protein
MRPFRFLPKVLRVLLISNAVVLDWPLLAAASELGWA